MRSKKVLYLHAAVNLPEDFSGDINDAIKLFSEYNYIGMDARKGPIINPEVVTSSDEIITRLWDHESGKRVMEYAITEFNDETQQWNARY